MQKPSHRALELAATLERRTPERLRRWLYDYGRRVPSIAEVRTGVNRNRLFTSELSRRISPGYQVDVSHEWEHWHQRSGLGAARPVHKLYISAALHHQDEVVEVVADAVMDSPVPAFKIARDRGKGLRTDWLIVYFETICGQLEWANMLDERIGHIKGAAVPFTCALNQSGTICAAQDPMPNLGEPPRSWRSDVTAMLADELCATSRVHLSPAARVDDVLAALEAGQIDTQRWCRSGSQLQELVLPEAGAS